MGHLSNQRRPEMNAAQASAVPSGIIRRRNSASPRTPISFASEIWHDVAKRITALNIGLSAMENLPQSVSAVSTSATIIAAASQFVAGAGIGGSSGSSRLIASRDRASVSRGDDRPLPGSIGDGGQQNNSGGSYKHSRGIHGSHLRFALPGMMAGFQDRARTA